MSPQPKELDRTLENHIKPFNRNACRWLEEILFERYGQKFLLRYDPPTTLILQCADVPEGLVTFDAVQLDFWMAGSNLPCSEWAPEAEGWASAIRGMLSAPGASQLPAPLIEQSSAGFVIHYDLLGLAYWMLTRQEEVDCTDLDEHGRFAATSSHAFKHGYLERPVVDEWLDILRQVIERTWPSIELKRHDFSMKVSHDVDAPSRHGFTPWRTLPRGMVGDLLKRRDPRGLLAPLVRLRTRQRLQSGDAFNSFDWLMTVSERHGLISAFYFIPDRRGTPHDSDYALEHPAIRDLLRRIHARGHEIGLHPSYNTFLDPAQIRHEAVHLRRVCGEEGIKQLQWGGRMHYLQWRQPQTLRSWNDAGMAYDSTMTYADRAGFRCGTCFEYPAFDPVANEALQLRIRPLVVMEGSIFGSRYMGLGVTEAARDKMLELKDTCRKVAGCFTLLWHNSSFQTHAEKQMYETIVSA